MNNYKKIIKFLNMNAIKKKISKNDSIINESSTLKLRDKISFDDLLNPYGVFDSTVELTDEIKHRISLWFDFKERAEIAMMVAQFYPGGDYFEFGSEGAGTLRNFLSSFDLTGKIKSFPDILFYAFDIFGDDTGAKTDFDYFKSWSDPKNNRLKLAQSTIQNHKLFLDKIFLVKGFFTETLNETFKNTYLSNNRRIGFAFLDCNISTSYSEVFSFLHGTLMRKSFIYMDEFFCNEDVPSMFNDFVCRENASSFYIRNAGCFGALFQVIKK